MADLEKLKQLIEENGYSYVLSDGERLVSGYGKGVKPLVDLIDGGLSYKGYAAADRIVGKAAALLYCVLEVSQLYAEVTTRDAVAVCTEHGIKISYGVLTDKIINRKGDGVCPMEQTVAEIDDPFLAYTAIKNKIASMQN